MRRTLQVVCLLVVALCLWFPTPTHAQIFGIGAPHVKLTITHPPLIPLKGVSKIAVFELEGECGKELTDRLEELVTKNGKLEVIDRRHLQTVLAEQDFHFTGRVDGATAARLGKILGPAAIIFGRVTQCRTEVKTDLLETDFKGNISNYMSRTRVNITASISLVELTTAHVLSARSFDGAGEQVARSRVGRPEAPDAHAVMVTAYENWIAQASPLLVPWQETVDFKVHNDDPKDKSWSLKLGAQYMKTGQFDQAAEQFKTVVDQHKNDTTEDTGKYLYKAFYDLGVALTYADRPAEGIGYLEESNRRKPDNNTTDAIAKAKKLARAQQDFALQGLTTDPSPPVASVPPSPPPSLNSAGTQLPARGRPDAPAPIASAPTRGTMPSSAPKPTSVTASAPPTVSPPASAAPDAAPAADNRWFGGSGIVIAVLSVALLGALAFAVFALRGKGAPVQAATLPVVSEPPVVPPARSPAAPVPPKFCHSCGTAVMPGQRFCRNCGAQHVV